MVKKSIIQDAKAQKLHNITGIIERITFHNQETGFCVLRLKVSGHRDLITVVGTILIVHLGESIKASGHFVNNSQHGLQFKAVNMQITAPSTLENIKKYLGSGLIKGIGTHFAKKLVDNFGHEIFNILESNPEKLMTLEGIGPTRGQQIIESWQQQKVIREIMLFLQNYKISSARAIRIYKIYGDKAIAKVQENPYRLAQDIYGIGFKTADILAKQMGIDEHSMIRAAAGTEYVMQNASQEGHAAMFEETLVEKTHKLLCISQDIIISAINKAIINQRLIKTETNTKSIIALNHLYYTEQAIAVHLKRLIDEAKLPWPVWEESQISQSLDKNTQLQLSSAQKKVLMQALQEKVFILTGGPGVGKTTIVKSLLHCLSHLRLNIALCAPTGRAAQRLNESTGWTAKTIHRLLGVDKNHYGFKHNHNNPLTIDLLIVDEVSMLDMTLMMQLLQALPSNTALWLIGDSDQLPSVGPGQVLNDLLESRAIPSAKLTEIFRQAATSKIVTNAHRINQGKMPIYPTGKTLSDFYFITTQTAEEIPNKILQLVQTRIPERFQLNPVQDIQILTPMNRGNIGTNAINHLLQKNLNQNTSIFIERFGIRFMVGDKIIQQVNNYEKEVFNGDIGYIESIHLETEMLHIRFGNKRIDYRFHETDELNLAYAMSIHKSQGSEYPAVIIPIALQHYRMLARNLLYTGVTRGKQLVILIGEKKALHIAIQTTNSNQRLTQLRKHIGHLNFTTAGF